MGLKLRPIVGGIIPTTVDEMTVEIHGSAVLWEPNLPFVATYRFLRFARDESKRVEFQAANGKPQTMFCRDLEDMIARGVTLSTAPIRALWRCQRRGRCFGIAYVGPVAA